MTAPDHRLLQVVGGPHDGLEIEVHRDTFKVSLPAPDGSEVVYVRVSVGFHIAAESGFSSDDRLVPEHDLRHRLGFKT